MQKILICGGRHYSNLGAIKAALLEIGVENIEVVIHGAAQGADSLGALAATQLGLPTQAFHANWRKHGKAAGPIRNQQMLDEGKPTLCLAFPDPESKGTWDMVRRARAAGVETKVFQ